MKDPKPLVSIVTVNFNQTAVTRDLLLSLKKISYTNIETIVIDNGSSDDSISSLAVEFPEIQLIKTHQNLGFAGGNNVGIKVAKGDYLLLLNNDVEVTPGFLEPLVETLENNPEAAVASPKIVYYGRDEMIQYAGSSKINTFTGRGRRIGYLETDKGQYDYIRPTELGHGACIMVSRKAISTVGLMPEDYFLYYEEHDWTETMKRHNFKVYYVGTSKIYHKESVSTGRNSPLKTYFLSRNRLLFARRNSSGIVLLISILYIVFIALPKNIFQLRSDKANSRAYMRGVLWNFFGEQKFPAPMMK
ncbi:MAG: glycosyltransferase family 2 protein [Bacteroidota bacterium]